MRRLTLNWALTIKMSESQRKAIEMLADRGFEAMAISA